MTIVESWQSTAHDQIGRRLFQASDELYLMAERPFPEGASYEDYAQHENGIGMARALYDGLGALPERCWARAGGRG